MLLSIYLAPVFQSSYNAIHWINLYLVDNAIRFSITYLLESDLSVALFASVKVWEENKLERS